MPTGSGTNSNINAGGQKIETRVLAPPGGYSNVSFGGENTQTEKFGDHNFNPKAQKETSSQPSTSIMTHSEPQVQKTVEKVPAAPAPQQQQQPAAQKQDYRGRGGSSGGGSSSITFG